jgi:hypothetical protein
MFHQICKEAHHSILYGLPHGILHVFNSILYEYEFQNPQRACIDNRFGFKDIFYWVDDRRIAVNKKKLSNFSAMKNRVAS